MAIKGQDLADVIADNSKKWFTKIVPKTTNERLKMWGLQEDGRYSKEGSSVVLMLTPPIGEPPQYEIVLTFKATNNKAEYKSIVTGL